MTDHRLVLPATRLPALLEGRMTQYRVPFKVQPPSWVYQDRHPGFSVMTPPGHIEFRGKYVDPDGVDHGPAAKFVPLPYAIGDRLWVVEAFNAFQFSQDGDEAWPVEVPTPEEMREAEELSHRFGAPQIVYQNSDRARKWFSDQPWLPAITMPRWASRLTLTVTDVRVQRVQEISWSDAARS